MILLEFRYTTKDGRIGVFLTTAEDCDAYWRLTTALMEEHPDTDAYTHLIWLLRTIRAGLSDEAYALVAQFILEETRGFKGSC